MEQVQLTNSGGEAVLIAKKVRLTDVIVSDTPKLRNHQGVNIYPVGDILDL